MSKLLRLFLALIVGIAAATLGPIQSAQAKNVNSWLFRTDSAGRTEGMVFSHPDRLACLIEISEAETSCQFEMYYKSYKPGAATFMNFEPQDQNGNKIGYAYMSISSSDEWKKTTVYLKFPSTQIPLVSFQGRDMYGKLFRASADNKPVVIYHQWPDQEWENYDSDTPFFSQGQYDLTSSGFAIEGGRYNFFIEVGGDINPKSWLGLSHASILIDLNGDETAEYSISTLSTKALRVGYGTPASLINTKTKKSLSQKNCDADAWLIDKRTFAFSFLTKCISMPMKFKYQAQVYDSKFRGLDVNPDWGLNVAHRNFGSDVVAAYSEVIAGTPQLEATAKVSYKRLSSSKLQLTVSNLVKNGKILIQKDWTDVASIEANDSAAAGLTVVDGAAVWVKTITLSKGNNIIVVYQDDDRIARYEFKY